MKNLSHRTFSAVIALIILIVALYFGREQGVFFLALFAVGRGAFEIARMFFADKYPLFVKRFFVAISLGAFLVITRDELQYATNFAIIFSFVLVASFGVIFHRYFQNLDQILTFVAKSCLGLVYTSFLPATVVWMTNADHGLQWFLCLLAVVFAGDIGAYIFGITLGKTKIAPLLSPNKSLQGALGGLLFSIFAGYTFHLYLPHVPVYALAACGLFGGLFGQIGDFFESLIKRVSGVKDSGSIMPGHGGVLDRLDGVLLSAPLFYFMAVTFTA